MRVRRVVVTLGHRQGSLAQLAEQGPLKPKVRSSILRRPTIKLRSADVVEVHDVRRESLPTISTRDGLGSLDELLVHTPLLAPSGRGDSPMALSVAFVPLALVGGLAVAAVPVALGAVLATQREVAKWQHAPATSAGPRRLKIVHASTVGVGCDMPAVQSHEYAQKGQSNVRAVCRGDRCRRSG